MDDTTPDFNVYGYQLRQLYKRVATLEETLNKVLNEWDKTHMIANNNPVYKKAKDVLNHYD